MRGTPPWSSCSRAMVPDAESVGRLRVADGCQMHASDTAVVVLSDGPWTVTTLTPHGSVSPDALADAAWRPLLPLAPTRVQASSAPDAVMAFRTRFAANPQPDTIARLRFDGIAAWSEVWLNGELLGESHSMFVATEADVTTLLRDENELVLLCRAERPSDLPRLPRARWRTALTDSATLRGTRTTLLGRMPGWSADGALIGPWRPITLQQSASVDVLESSVDAQLRPDGLGAVTIAMRLRVPPARTLRTLIVSAGDVHLTVPTIAQLDGSLLARGTVLLADVPRWWPHTHGEAERIPVSAWITTDRGSVTVPLGRVGFREIRLDTGSDGRDFRFIVNGTPLFARGVNWMPLDPARLTTDATALRAALTQTRDAGFNMVRVPGTTAYESDAFHDLCDELGILVWQDAMFANFDYPWADARFASAATSELRQLCSRLHRHPSTAIICGGSEMGQQAAMLGLPPDTFAPGQLFQRLHAAAHELAPGTPVVADSPWSPGGDVPMRTDSGVVHYFGVGAYRRPLDDARRANVKFAAECLAFANVPDAVTLVTAFGSSEPALHTPAWKTGVPRDTGASWDFDDVCDHYLRELFDVDPRQLRVDDAERYFRLSRIVTGEVIASTLGEWRRAGHASGGALLWTARDVRPGAGWGLVDVTGRPKAAWYYARRACAPLAAWFTNEGLNGLALHLANDGGLSRRCRVELTAFRDGAVRVGQASTEVELAPHASIMLESEALFGGFRDITWSYRFGPPAQDVVHAVVRDAETLHVLADATELPLGLSRPMRHDLGLVAHVSGDAAHGWHLTLSSSHFAQAVSIECAGFVAEDNYSHIVPGHARRIRLHAESPNPGEPRGVVRAINSTVAVPLIVDADSPGRSGDVAAA
jgi:beta-mannosidase